MTYQRPQYVWLPPELDKKGKEIHARMAIYIDNYIYSDSPERNDALIYEYIYHICYMLSCKHKLFQTARDYDEFSLYCAAKVYARLVNTRQFTEVEGKKPLEKIDSVLNYIKNSLFGMKVSYQREAFAQVFDPELGFDSSAFKSQLHESIQESYNEDLVEAIFDCIKELPKITQDIIKETPYGKDSIISRRLYLSCMLSILNNFILSKKLKAKVEKKEAKNNCPDELKIGYIDQQKDNCIILWRLDNNMRDYVDLLVKIIKRKLADEITDARDYYELPETVLDQVLNSPWTQYSTHNVEDEY